MPWENSLFIFVSIPSSEYLVQNAGRQIALVMLLLGYHLWFQVDFACPCTSKRNIIHCYSYMVLPSFIIISFILWNDKRIGRIFRFACYHSSIKNGRCSLKFCFDFFIYVLQAAASGFLWCGSVLVDGDWYVCCGHNEDLMALSCMKDNEIGLAKKARKVHLKNESMIIGLICLLLTAVCSFVLMLPWSRWLASRNYFRAMFEEAILEQTEDILWKEMEKAATDSVKRSLASLSSSETSETPSSPKKDPENMGKSEEKEEILLNLNVNWDEIACLADVILEGIPKNLANDNTV